jgi:hypothetical protein
VRGTRGASRGRSMGHNSEAGAKHSGVLCCNLGSHTAGDVRWPAGSSSVHGSLSVRDRVTQLQSAGWSNSAGRWHAGGPSHTWRTEQGRALGHLPPGQKQAECGRPGRSPPHITRGQQCWWCGWACCLASLLYVCALGSCQMRHPPPPATYQVCLRHPTAHIPHVPTQGDRHMIEHPPPQHDQVTQPLAPPPMPPGDQDAGRAHLQVLRGDAGDAGLRGHRQRAQGAAAAVPLRGAHRDRGGHRLEGALQLPPPACSHARRRTSSGPWVPGVGSVRRLWTHPLLVAASSLRAACEKQLLGGSTMKQPAAAGRRAGAGASGRTARVGHGTRRLPKQGCRGVTGWPSAPSPLAQSTWSLE